MKLLNLVFLALVTLSLSCKNQAAEETKKLYENLVVGHDEVMPKSMAIYAIKDKMMKAVEGASEEKTAQALEISTRLMKAEDQMNVWMEKFGDAINGEESQKLEVYKKLQEEITQLNLDTDAAIKDAKALTAEFIKE